MARHSKIKHVNKGSLCSSAFSVELDMTKLASALIVALTCLLGLPMGESETFETCYGMFRYRCMGQHRFQMCNNLVPTGILYDCSTMGGDTCYPSQWDTDTACGPPPPPCTAEGNFPLAGKCSIYQSCVSTGKTDEFNSFIMDCRTGYEFGVAFGHCVPESDANCTLSSSATPTPTPTTTTAQPPLTTPPCVGANTREVYPHNCTQYISCNANKIGTVTTCPFSMLFNDVTATCASSVACGSRPNPLTSTSLAPTTLTTPMVG